MKALLLFAALILLAGLNLVLNFTVPNHLKLVLVPAFAFVVILIAVKTLRRPQ